MSSAIEDLKKLEQPQGSFGGLCILFEIDTVVDSLVFFNTI